MVARYIGDYRSIYKYWWFDADKISRLEAAQANNESLPVGEVEVTYWPDFLKKQNLTEAN